MIAQTGQMLVWHEHTRCSEHKHAQRHLQYHRQCQPRWTHSPLLLSPTLRDTTEEGYNREDSTGERRTYSIVEGEHPLSVTYQERCA